MLVDANAHPGPALFQGIGFIAIAIYFLWSAAKDRINMENKEEKRKSEREEAERRFTEALKRDAQERWGSK